MARKRVELTDEGALATLDAGGILERIGQGYPARTVEVLDLPLEQLRPNPFQPRQHFDEESLEELAHSLREHGFYGHLLVRRAGRIYQLAYGERRLRAAGLAGLEMVPVQVRELSDGQMMEIALTENVLREDLHPIEEAEAYARLQRELGYSVRRIADKIGKSKSYVGSMLSLIRHPDVADAVRNADIPVRTAEELAKIEDPGLRRRLTARVVAGVLDREGLIHIRQVGEAPAKGVRSADRQNPVAALRRVYRSLERQRGDQVDGPDNGEAILLLKQIIQRATDLLEELEG